MIRLLFLAACLCATQAAAQQPPCRVRLEKLRPIVRDENPYVYDYSYDPSTRTEHGYLGPDSEFYIEQGGCERRHITYRLLMARLPEDLRPDVALMRETFSMLQRVYYERPEYYTFKREFEEEFLDYLRNHGLNKKFNFPLPEKTFICLLETGDWGAAIKIEQIDYVHTQEIVPGGVRRFQDDGFFKPHPGR